MEDASNATESSKPRGPSPHRSLKRAALVLLFLVLIGAAVNVPLSVCFDKSRTESPRVPSIMSLQGPAAGRRGWPASTPHAQPWPAVTSWAESGAFGYRKLNAWSRTHPDLGFSMTVDLMGWPFPVLRRVQMWWPWEDPNWQTTRESDPAVMLAWKGLIVNPLLFGVSLWIVFFLLPWCVIAGRRRSRRRRECCLQCGYPIGASDRCSECGVLLSGT